MCVYACVCVYRWVLLVCVCLYVCQFVCECLCKCESLSVSCIWAADWDVFECVCTEEEAVPCAPQEKRGNPIHVSSLAKWWGTQHHPCLVVSMHVCVSEDSCILWEDLYLHFLKIHLLHYCRFCVNCIFKKERSPQCSITQNLSRFKDFFFLLFFPG